MEKPISTTLQNGLMGPLIDREDIKKILEMNRAIVSVNCSLLKWLATPSFIVDTGLDPEKKED